ncbi:uncharacterized protein LOC121736217 [Aricia agestis]|uniref:uncharacterized protein LOC121736217 n=1 Tax=Aricia agestis TaxID=91739 RepID=UPI001C2029A6|nr:uncharacterized protein LOC121736217 [Aricia agestis]
MDTPIALVIGKEVTRTPEGTLVVTDDVVLQRSASGRIMSYRPEHLSVSDDLMLFDAMQEEPSEEPDVDDALAEAFADSGSEAEEDEDIPEEFEDAESVQSNAIFDWTDDYSLFRGAQEEFHESDGPKIEGTRC